MCHQLNGLLNVQYSCQQNQKCQEEKEKKKNSRHNLLTTMKLTMSFKVVLFWAYIIVGMWSVLSISMWILNSYELNGDFRWFSYNVL